MLGNIKFTKELFVETMDVIEKQYRHDFKCSEAFKVILPFDHVSTYVNHYTTDQLIKILKIAMNDSYDIRYFIHDLDFGKKYYPGCIKIDGKNFELKSSSDLWDLLNREENEDK